MALSASITLALLPLWPVIPSAGLSFGTLVGWLLAEAGLGIGVGLAVAFLAEIFQMGAQIISLQAGYSFASTIDPTSGADSSVLLSIAQTTAGLLFFATGLDRQVLLAFAHSLRVHPPGTSGAQHLHAQPGDPGRIGDFQHRPAPGASAAGAAADRGYFAGLAGASEFAAAAHQLAFPIKMLLSLGLLAWLVLVFPQVFAQAAGPILRLVRSFCWAESSLLMAGDSHSKTEKASPRRLPQSPRGRTVSLLARDGGRHAVRGVHRHRLRLVSRLDERHESHAADVAGRGFPRRSERRHFPRHRLDLLQRAFIPLSVIGGLTVL